MVGTVRSACHKTYPDVVQTVCTDCGGTVIEYDAAAGNGFCVQCGTVVEENTIVNEVRSDVSLSFNALTTWRG